MIFIEEYINYLTVKLLKYDFKVTLIFCWYVKLIYHLKILLNEYSFFKSFNITKIKTSSLHNIYPTNRKITLTYGTDILIKLE